MTKDEAELAEKFDKTINKLCKWRQILAGWIMGSGTKSDPGVQGMRDLQDARLITRVELSAIAALCIKKGVFTAAEFTAQAIEEAEVLDKLYTEKFKGMRTTDEGITIYDIEATKATMKRLGFPD